MKYYTVVIRIKMPDDKKDSKDDGKKSGSSSQSGQIGGFRDIPVDFSAGNDGDNKKNKNKNQGGSGGKKKLGFNVSGCDIHTTTIS